MQPSDCSMIRKTQNGQMAKNSILLKKDRIMLKRSINCPHFISTRLIKCYYTNIKTAHISSLQMLLVKSNLGRKKIKNHFADKRKKKAKPQRLHVDTYSCSTHFCMMKRLTINKEIIRNTLFVKHFPQPIVLF